MLTFEELVKYSKYIRKGCNCESDECDGNVYLYLRPSIVNKHYARIRWYCDFHKRMLRGKNEPKFVRLSSQEDFTLRVILNA